MKVKTTKRFRDLSEDKIREVGDTFELKDSERVSFLVEKGFVKTVEGDKTEKPKTPKAKKGKSGKKAGE